MGIPLIAPPTTTGVPSTQPVPPLLITAAVAAPSRPPPPLMTTVGSDCIARSGHDGEPGDAAVGDDGGRSPPEPLPPMSWTKGTLCSPTRRWSV